MCKCITEVLDNLNGHYAETNSDMIISSMEFQNAGLVLGNPGGWQLAIPIEIMYKQKRKDGTIPGKDRKKIVNMFPTYCPFCGKKRTNDKN